MFRFSSDAHLYWMCVSSSRGAPESRTNRIYAMLYQYCSECGTWCRAMRLGNAFRSLRGFVGVDMWVWNIDNSRRAGRPATTRLMI
ncbi:hypothetical protein HBH56_150070 [Parastagonospora nodorum]|uniref:Uncharacterized protein n=1 Tax=Phaeosphaeria nodorum (strain SN15 / ATCC MYA-4574 / FGSC 10173) TaxID=321614 RepID=A0A7U2F060_PHANO|nr:hypothetical protein HBH56_150070 [Parastagonospora nodorum]QRC94235.1 hypothetical protein JI435_074990 [Parastagonospora nodorum SN15]KAH3928276.1 hypothetical protein HBH54_135970 [Parastagonospora nodorum]KAH3945952.1 hypothetical protein HBH53_137520 [Parastagonospora nodorum]KAH4003434.1 hypothetical protein HBI10_060440 [Parastagonospora nodorum]